MIVGGASTGECKLCRRGPQMLDENGWCDECCIDIEDDPGAVADDEPAPPPPKKGDK